MNDAGLLAAVPDFISIGGLLKATPQMDGDARILYFEASNEDKDYQNEVVLQKALSGSAPYFLRHGNIDISHFSLLGPKLGIADYMEYEIGKPRDVSVSGKRTFVKAELYRGESPMAKKANMVWDSLTKQIPPSSWFPSVGGAVLKKEIKIDEKTGDKIGVVTEVRWSNVALDRQPVNGTVPEVSLVPVGTFAKAFGGFLIGKGITAGYGTDSARFTGGAALRVQSLTGSPANYFDFRDRMAKDLLENRVGRSPKIRDIVTYAAKSYQMPIGDAALHVERFMDDLNAGRAKRRIAAK